ncbi:MAG: hypothetical protein GWN08_20735, partial [Gemmatimonadetes bacterium]|nr:hypothetical protein [Gemmatimonadota bacterium]NIW77640.1 hypothetical protein [Gemmatimonadota bacterium]
VAVLTTADLGDAIAPLPVAHKIENLLEPPHPVLANGQVRFVGEPVAAVVAETAA